MAITINNSNTLSLLNILNRTAAQQENTLTQLSTGLRINRGSDDPAGLIALRSLDTELIAVDASIVSNQRTDAILNVADSALTEVASLLNEIQNLTQSSANEAGLSASEVAANQAQIDTAISALDRIIRTTSFNGKKLLDGSYGINVNGVTAADITNVRVFSRDTNATSNTISVEISSAAQRAAVTGFGTNSATSLTTISIQGKLGTALIDIAIGENLSAVTAKINNATATTGVVASQTGATAAIGLRSQDFGSAALVRVSVLSGDATNYNNGNDTGTDAGITVNGQTVGVDGLDVNFNSNGLSLEFSISTAFNLSAAGTTSTFTVDSTGGATFQLGTDSTTRATIGIDGLYSQQLGSAVLGRLSTLKSGGVNSLLNDPGQASAIATKAAEQVAQSQGRIGGFQKFQVRTALNTQNATKAGLEAARSIIGDVDYATATAELNRQQVLLQVSISLLGLANQQSSQVLSLLR